MKPESSAGHPVAALVPYRGHVTLLIAAAQALRIPFPAWGTACRFLHLLSEAPFFPSWTAQRVVACVLLVATKVEEVPLRVSDLLNATQLLARALPSGSGWSWAHVRVALSNGAGDVLTGEAYYGAKSELLSDEQHLLRHLRFKVLCKHPHRVALNLCRSAGAGREASAASVCLLNDAMAMTDVCVRQPVEYVAAGAVHAAMHIVNAPCEPVCLPLGTAMSSFWESVGLDAGRVCTVGGFLLQMTAAAAGPVT